jgi:hypothetical protein
MTRAQIEMRSHGFTVKVIHSNDIPIFENFNQQLITRKTVFNYKLKRSFLVVDKS